MTYSSDKMTRARRAIAAVADDVASSAHVFASSGPGMPDPAEEMAHISRIRAIADSIRDVADTDLTPATYHRIEALRGELADLGKCPGEKVWAELASALHALGGGAD